MLMKSVPIVGRSLERVMRPSVYVNPTSEHALYLRLFITTSESPRTIRLVHFSGYS